VLPTAGAARYRGGLNAADFVKLVSVQRLSERGLRRIASTITTLARAEGLEGHARSIEIRVGEPGLSAAAFAKAEVGNRKSRDLKTQDPEPKTSPLKTQDPGPKTRRSRRS
jgi:hypothetical protein